MCSAVKNFEARYTIRQSWARDTETLKNVQVVFLVGQNINNTHQEQLMSESDQYGDIIQVRDHRDGISSQFKISSASVFAKVNDTKFQDYNILSSSLNLSIYLSLFISIFLFLWEIELTLWSLSTTTPHHTTINFLRTLALTYTQVWYIIGIVSSSPTYFCTENIGFSFKIWLYRAWL